MGNTTVNYENDFTVLDGRIKPFTEIPRIGTMAISKGQLEPKEISVYLVLNMMLDGVIKLKTEEYVKAIAHCTGLTERQVENSYKKLHDIGLLHVTKDNVTVAR